MLHAFRCLICADGCQILQSKAVGSAGIYLWTLLTYSNDLFLSPGILVSDVKHGLHKGRQYVFFCIALTEFVKYRREEHRQCTFSDLLLPCVPADSEENKNRYSHLILDPTWSIKTYLTACWTEVGPGQFSPSTTPIFGELQFFSYCTRKQTFWKYFIFSGG